MNKELREIILENKEYCYGKSLKRVYRIITHN